MQARSMTGFGKAKAIYKNKQIVVELKSVNSKQLDLGLRMPHSLRDFEPELRTLIAEIAERGKVDASIYFEGEATEKKVVLNQQLAANYYNEMQAFAKQIKANTDNLLGMVLNLPEVFKQEVVVVGKDELKKVKEVLSTALSNFNNFRLSEGKSLSTELLKRVNMILALLKSIETADSKRIKAIRTRIQKSLVEALGKDKADSSRFEEELIYYLEKLDITEEKVRLKTHCDYFKQTLKEPASGRKLGFISQEIGREINTIGSKANDAAIQKMVVQMKDELEKIKEQLLNIL